VNLRDPRGICNEFRFCQMKKCVINYQRMKGIDMFWYDLNLSHFIIVEKRG